MNLKEIAESLGVPESTLRLYREEFEEFLPVTGEGRRRRYSTAAAATLARIAALKREGWSGARIREELARTETPVAKLRARTTEDRLDELQALVTGQSAEIVRLRLETEVLREDIGRLIAALHHDHPQTMAAVMAGYGEKS